MNSDLWENLYLREIRIRTERRLKVLIIFTLIAQFAIFICSGLVKTTIPTDFIIVATVPLTIVFIFLIHALLELYPGYSDD